MELFELQIWKSGDLIVLLLCYNILFYFNLYSSLAATKGLCIYVLNINTEKLNIITVFNLQLVFSS